MHKNKIECINGEIKVGDIVMATPTDDYAYLIGKVTQITSPYEFGHTSGNATDDIYVDFTAFDYSHRRKAEIENMLESLSGCHVKFDEAALDDVIVAPEFIMRLNGIEPNRLKQLLNSRDEASEFYYGFMQGKETISSKEDITMDNNTKATLPFQMEVTAHPIEPKGSLLGFANVTVNEAITIKDFRILNGENGLFVGMPSKPDQSSEKGYRNTVYISKDYLDTFSDAVIGAYQITLKREQSHTAKLNTPEKRPMKEQYKEAQKAADRHNASLPTQEKSSISRGER